VVDNNNADNPSEPAPSPSESAITQAFDFLFLGLREAKRVFETGDDAGREGAIHAVEIVIKFLSRFDLVKSESLHAPLARLFTDLMALNDGVASTMLKPKARSGRARSSGAYDALKGIAVFTVRRLEATGMQPVEARKTVASTLDKLNVRPARKGSDGGTGQITERTVRTWEGQIAADVGCHTVPAQTLKEAEEKNIEEVVTGIGLSGLPEDSTPDKLLLPRYAIKDLRRFYLDRLANYVENTRSAETT
jgi:hypothetical protein